MLTLFGPTRSTGPYVLNGFALLEVKDMCCEPGVRCCGIPRTGDSAERGEEDIEEHFRDEGDEREVEIVRDCERMKEG